MKIKLCDVSVKWINVDTDIEKNKQMVELFNRLGMKNTSRVSAVTNVPPHEGVRAGEEHYRNCAESHFKILNEAIDSQSFPVLILEDDVDIEVGLDQHIADDLEIPDDADAIYFGTSHGDGRYAAVDQENGWSKVERVFATHAIMYMNERIAKEVIKTGKRWIYEHNRPFDVGFAYEVQPSYNVYAPYVPFFYQADAKNNVNKWEQITRTPLKRSKKFSIFTG